MVPTGPWFEALRAGDFEGRASAGHSEVNPVLDVQTLYLPGQPGELWEARRPALVALYEKVLNETDLAKQRRRWSVREIRAGHSGACDVGAVVEPLVPYRSYVKGWKIAPPHYINLDLATVWLDK